MDYSDLRSKVAHLPSKSAKIRALNSMGVPRADIGRVLEIKYQFVRNVLVAEAAKAQPDDRHAFAHVDNAGRILIPANIRKILGLCEGDQVSFRLDDEGLRVETRQAALKRARDIIRKHVPDGVSLADELIADRRKEAANE